MLSGGKGVSVRGSADIEREVKYRERGGKTQGRRSYFFLMIASEKMQQPCMVRAREEDSSFVAWRLKRKKTVLSLMLGKERHAELGSWKGKAIVRDVIRRKQKHEEGEIVKRHMFLGLYYGESLEGKNGTVFHGVGNGEKKRKNEKKSPSPTWGNRRSTLL